jgi:signal transduction histidine kinase/CheY-like chemotaxis protein
MRGPALRSSLLITLTLALLPLHGSGADEPRRVVYGGDREYPPFEWLDEAGQPQGFNVALIRAIARRAGVEVEFRLGSWDTTMQAFDRGQIDLMSLAYSEARAARYDFLGQTWTLHQAVLFPPGRRAYPDRLDSLATEVVAVERRTLMHELLLELPEFQRPALVHPADQRETVQMLVRGDATAMAGNAMSLRYSAARLGVRGLIEVPVKAMSYHLAVPRGTRAQFAWLETGLETTRRTGELDRLVEQHLASLPPGDSWREWIRYVAAGVLVIVLLAVGVLIWNRSLQRQVRARTRELADLLQEKERLAGALAESEKAAVDASRLKSEFLANMSHELRTPLNGVIGMGRLLAETDLTARQREYLDIVTSSGRSLLAVISDVLDFSKIESGRVELEATEFDLRDAVEEVVRASAEAAQGKGLELACVVDPALPRLARGDAWRLRQALTNLVGNAVKFTEQGEVVVEVRQEREDADGCLVRLTVRDTGVGITEEARARLFSAFVQADGSTTRRYGGTGLGLVIARRLAELMGGEMDAQSTPGQGSRFWFTVRLGHVRTEPPPRDLEGVAVLVADAHDPTRTALLHALEPRGALVARAADGPGALELAGAAARAGRPFAVALVQAGLLTSDGRDLPRVLADDASAARPRVLVLTALGDVDSPVADGAPASLRKPVSSRALHQAILEILGRAGAAPLRPSGATTSPARLRRVLLAEDNAVNRKVAAAILTRLGYAVDLVADGGEAVAAHAQNAYAAILMDCQMPEMDGQEATALIRAEEARRGSTRTPIIALTASALSGDRERCLAAGMDDYLSKPFTPQQLADVLQPWTGGSTDLSVAPRPTARSVAAT